MMRDKVKHRLIGLLAVLVCLAVIYPLYMTGDGYIERQIDPLIAELPEAPALIDIEVSSEVAELIDASEGSANVAVPTIEPVAPPVAAATAPALSTETIQAKEKAEPRVSLDDTPVLDTTGIPVAWSLQLGTFGNEENAKRLEQQLIKDGHKVYTRRSGSFVQLFVGPDIQKSRLTGLQSQIDKQLGIKSKLVRFSPN